MLLDFNADASEVFAQRSDVSAERLLSVDEIIARHRLQQASQDNRLQHYSARILMEQRFHATVADPGYDVVTETDTFQRDPTSSSGKSCRSSIKWFAGRVPTVRHSRCCSRRSALAAALTPVGRGLPLSFGGCGQGRRVRLLRRGVRPGPGQSVALPRNGVDRPPHLRAHPRSRPCRRTCQHPWCRMRRRNAIARFRPSTASQSSCLKG